MGQSPRKSRKRKKSSTVSLNCRRQTSFRECSTRGTPPVLLRIRNSSRWMWMGCCQPPELFCIIHLSEVFLWHVKRMLVLREKHSAAFPLIFHSPFCRTKSKVRVTRDGTLIDGSW